MKTESIILAIDGIDLNIEYDYFRAEKETSIDPGHPEEVEIVAVFLLSDPDENDIIDLIRPAVLKYLEAMIREKREKD